MKGVDLSHYYSLQKPSKTQITKPLREVNMIGFKDFAPQVVKKGIFKTKFESFEAAVGAANAWMEFNDIDVVNVETVVLPRMHQEEGTTDVALTSMGDMMDVWYQFVRVWYKR